MSCRCGRPECFECKVCGNCPGDDGFLAHGKGCYTQSEDGGGEEYIPEAVRNQGETTMSDAKFSVGQKVKHAANAGGAFPAGTGTVESVTPWNTGDGYSYQVRCDKTGRVLPVNFKESELTAA